MTPSILRRRFAAAVATVAIATFGLAATSAHAFNSGDVPAPVDQNDNAGPGNSHQSSSGISGTDGNQGNDRNVGNAGGARGNSGSTGGGRTGGDTGSGDSTGGDGESAPAPQ